MRFALAVLIRVVGIALAAALGFWVTNIGFDGQGVNIGAALAAMLAVALVSLIWAFVDAWRSGRPGRTVAIWVVVGIISVAPSLGPALTGGVDWSTSAETLAMLVPLSLAETLIPALLGIAAGHIAWVVRRRRKGTQPIG